MSDIQRIGLSTVKVDGKDSKIEALWLNGPADQLRGMVAKGNMECGTRNFIVNKVNLHELSGCCL